MNELVSMYPATVSTSNGGVVGRFYAWEEDGVQRARQYVVSGGHIAVGLDAVIVAGLDGVNSHNTCVITTADGEEWTVSPGGGCGCGSPLKTFLPNLHGVEAPA